MGNPMGGLECKNPTHGAPLSGLGADHRFIMVARGIMVEVIID
jgi:hypothetical protein